jgi:hypothetical protein
VVQGRRLSGVALSLALGGCGPLTPISFELPPLSLAEPIGGLTSAKVARLAEDPAACYAWMDQQGLTVTPVKDQLEDDFCDVRGALTVGETGAFEGRLSPARPMMTCGLAAGLAVWRKHSLEPAAAELLGAKISRIDHLGVYACRRTYGAADTRRSAHARAAAIDVAGVRLSDGRRVRVEQDWGKDTAEGRFLQRIRAGACRVFRTTLSPEYNAAHANHFHLEVDRTRVCS